MRQQRKGAARAAPSLDLSSGSISVTLRRYRSVPVVMVVAPVVVIPRPVIVVVIAVVARADADADARALEIDALRHSRRGGSDRHRADERDDAENSRQVPRHGSSPACWRSRPCCRMQPDALGQRVLPRTGPASRWNPAEEELNRFDGTTPRLSAPS